MGAAVTWVKACVGMAAVGARLRMCCAGSAVCVSVRVLPVRLRPWTGVGLLVSPCGPYAGTGSRDRGARPRRSGRPRVRQAGQRLLPWRQVRGMASGPDLHENWGTTPTGLYCRG